MDFFLELWLINFFSDNRTYPLVPKKFAVAVILEQDFYATHAETKLPAKYRWLTEEEFYDSDLTLHGMFGNADSEVREQFTFQTSNISLGIRWHFGAIGLYS